jgi:hypothetical protein
MSEDATEIDLYRLVGAVAVEAANAEKVLADVYAHLMTSKYALIVVAGLNARTVIEGCEALINVHTDLERDQKERGLTLVKRMDRHRRLRNDVIHSVLAEDQSEGADKLPPHLTRIFAKTWKPGQTKNLHIDVLQKLPGEIRVTMRELAEWAHECRLFGQQHVLPM